MSLAAEMLARHSANDAGALVVGALVHSGAVSDKRREVTRLLLAWSDGDGAALERLMPLVSEELRRIARRHMRKERRDHTLQPTALVNELYMKLVDRDRVSWESRTHFFGAAAEMMRRILVDHARIRRAEKRRHGEKPLPLDEARDALDERDDELIALDDALVDLAKRHARQARVVELHFFAGLKYEEIGEVLGVSPTTIKRDWKAARAWLFDQIKPG